MDRLGLATSAYVFPRELRSATLRSSGPPHSAHALLVLCSDFTHAMLVICSHGAHLLLAVQSLSGSVLR